MDADFEGFGVDGADAGQFGESRQVGRLADAGEDESDVFLDVLSELGRAGCEDVGAEDGNVGLKPAFLGPPCKMDGQGDRGFPFRRSFGRDECDLDGVDFDRYADAASVEGNCRDEGGVLQKGLGLGREGRVARARSILQRRDLR